MTEIKGLLHAYSISESGLGTVLKGGKEITEAVESSQLAWVHLDANEPDVNIWLESDLKCIDSIIVDALVAEEARPRILQFDSGTLLILRGVNLNEDAKPEDMVSIRMWIDKSRIISVRRRRLKAVSDITEKLLSGKGPKNSGEFITMLIGRLFERMEPVFSELDEELNTLEEKIMDTPEAVYRQEINSIRRRSILFRRYMAPQRDVIAALRISDQPWLKLKDKRHLQESLDDIIRYIEDIDSIRERGQIIKDELTNALSDRMNKNLYMLSVVAAIFLPLGFFTGLLGINVGGIPGSENGSAFFVFCAMLVGVVVFQISLFKFLKWF